MGDSVSTDDGSTAVGWILLTNINQRVEVTPEHLQSWSTLG